MMGNGPCMDVERVQVKTYDGTPESASEVLYNLNVEDDFYHFNVKNGYLLLHQIGLMLRPGDCYQYRLPQSSITATGKS